MGKPVLFAALFLIYPASSGLVTDRQSGGGVVQRNATEREPSFAPLPGRVVGIIATDVSSSVQAEGRSCSEDAVGFSHGASSYRWVFFPTQPDSKQAERLFVPVGLQGSTRHRYDSVLFGDLVTAAKHGITGRFTLVELEVNDGLGSPSVESFVATKVTVVGGTAEYPLDVSASVLDAQKRFEDYLQKQDEMIEHELKRLARKALGTEAPTGPREETETLFVTWLPGTESLRIELERTITDGRYRRGRGADQGPPPTGQQPRQPGRQPEDGVGVRFGTQFGLRIGMTVEYSKDGTPASENRTRIHGFIVELPPPQRSRLQPPG